MQLSAMEKEVVNQASGVAAMNSDKEVKHDKSVTEETEDDSEFIWDEYLEETSAIAAAPTSFIHVEKSLLSCFTSGMKLEVPTKDNPNEFWIASIILTCGPLLRLRYEGFADDRCADFWCDISAKDIHPVGWCLENNARLVPPTEIKDKIGNWDEFVSNALKDAKTVPQCLLEANCTTPVDLIKQGMKLEIQEKLNPTHVWIATVFENVGGRLLLRYEGASSGEDFWLFYLSYRVHPVGWSQENNYKYAPPESIVSKCGKEACAEMLQAAIAEASKMPLLHDIFENQEKIKTHRFEVGTKLEAVHPGTLVQFYPATVTEVIDERFFLVQIDDHSLVDQQRHVTCCHAESPYVLPMGWASSKGFKVMHPRGWTNYKHELDAKEYLSHCNAEAAPNELFMHHVGDHGFEVGMKLEAINPFQPNQICAATITKICDHLLWIQLDSIDSFNPNHIVPVTSHDIFPVGWCESNRYPLKPPLNVQQSRGRLMKKVAIFIQEKQRKQPGKSDVACDVKAWCPKLYFNHRCFSGPYLSKGRIAELPRDVGPGPVTLVLKEVLSKLINVAYKSSKVLQELQLKGKANPNMQQCTLKAKYKGKSHRSIVEVLRNSEHIEEFCHQICRKLGCCPYLFGPRYVGETCPEECSHLTKTNYPGSTAKKKKKIVQPQRNPDGSVKIPRKRGRKPKVRVAAEDTPNDTEKSSESSQQEFLSQKDATKDSALAQTGVVPESTKDDTSKEGKQLKRKYVRYVPPKSEIVTRGAKLPNFALGFQCWRKRKTAAERIERKVPKKQRVSRQIVVKAPLPPSRDSSDDNSKSSSETPSETNTDSMEDKDSTTQETISIPSDPLLDSNPLYWSVDEVIQYMKDTDCAQMARLFKEQDIDGQALLLLTLPIVQEHLELKLGPAIKLCKQVEKIKFAFYSQYAK